jgi:hypothetical protein
MCDAPFYESSLRINGSLYRDIEEAADEIARLRAEVERLNGDALAGADPFENGWEPGNDIKLYRSRIKELMAEVERLTRQVDHWIGYARATETHAARLEDRRADLAARAADLALKAQAVAKADRAARDLAVAEAVREACAKEVGTGTPPHVRIRALDIAAVVAAALKKEGE